MVQTITREWEIAKAYMYEVALRDGVISLDWDDFQALAEGHRPLVAIKAEGDAAVKELVANAMNEIKKQCSSSPSGLIVAISYRKGEEIMMDEMFGLSDSMDDIATENVEIKWGISQHDSKKSKRCVWVFAFE